MQNHLGKQWLTFTDPPQSQPQPQSLRRVYAYLPDTYTHILLPRPSPAVPRWNVAKLCAMWLSEFLVLISSLPRWPVVSLAENIASCGKVTCKFTDIWHYLRGNRSEVRMRVQLTTAALPTSLRCCVANLKLSTPTTNWLRTLSNTGGQLNKFPFSTSLRIHTHIKFNLLDKSVTCETTTTTKIAPYLVLGLSLF